MSLLRQNTNSIKDVNLEKWKLDPNSKGHSFVVCVGLQENQVFILNANGHTR